MARRDDTDRSVLDKLDEPTRRALLAGAGAGATSFLAGCSAGGGGDGGQGGTPTQGGEANGTATGTGQSGVLSNRPKLAHVDGQTLVAAMAGNPKDQNFAATGAFRRPVAAIESRVASQALDFMQDPGFGSANWNYEKEKVEFLGYQDIIEDWTIKPNSFEWTYKKGYKWATGNQITGRDALPMLLWFNQFLVFRGIAPPLSEVADLKKEELPANAAPLGLVVDYEYDGRTARLLTEGEGFKKFLARETNHKDDLINAFTKGFQVWRGFFNDTSVEPYDQWADAAFEKWDKLAAGEIGPDDLAPFHDSAQALGQDIDSKKDGKYDAEYFRKPENANKGANGAFKLKEIVGTQKFVLEKNPEYYHADKVNFDRVEVRSRPEERANWAALKANRLDVYHRGTVPYNAQRNFPDNIETRRTKSQGGKRLVVNHQTSVFKDPRARQGLMQVLNTDRIGNTIHRKKYRGCQIIGAHTWNYTKQELKEYLPNDVTGTELEKELQWRPKQKFVDENLHDYTKDDAKAAEFFKAAGWTKDGSTWKFPNGDKAKLTIPTPASTPELEVSIATQLSNFGIETQIQTMSQDQWDQKIREGKFQLTNMPGPYMTGFTGGFLNQARTYRRMVVTKGIWKKLGRVFPKEMVESAEYAEDTGKVKISARDHFWIKAPPIGEFDGELKKWYPLKEQMVMREAKGPEEYVKGLKTMTWLQNWHLPMLPLLQEYAQFFVDSHFIWPGENTRLWHGVGGGGELGYVPEDLVGRGFVQADPDNPESGASVQE